MELGRNQHKTTPAETSQGKARRSTKQGKELNSLASSSEVMIYKKAVCQIAPEFETEIEKFINDVRTEQTEHREVNPPPQDIILIR